jgi:aliphatic nitrilase
VSEEIIDEMSKTRPENRELLTRKNSAFSGIIDPAGNLIGDPLIDEEGIVYADIDLNDCVAPKQMHDIIGGYNRFDIFDLRIDRSVRQPIDFESRGSMETPDERKE